MSPLPTVVGAGPCAECGHDPACGFASLSDGEKTWYYCHDDDHSCYDKVTHVELTSVLKAALGGTS